MEKVKILEKVRIIDGWLSDHETYFLYLSARDQIKLADIVEIGSFKGKSTVALGLGALNSESNHKVFAIDPHLGEYFKNQNNAKPTLQIFNKNIKRSGLENVVETIVSTSQKAAKGWKNRIGLLFIDGMHDYRNSKLDYLLWNKYVINSGIIAFHDAFCAYTGVFQTVRDKFFRRSDLVELGTVGSIIFGKIGQPNIFQKLTVGYKKTVFKYANYLNSLKIPWIFKLIFIHKLTRFLLISKYSFKIQFL